ncbi:MAG: hypothetical protein M3380_21725 [Chloroflexota bacterium]|nr:hypothetical protein [Chloroflexota bacterium]
MRYLYSLAICFLLAACGPQPPPAPLEETTEETAETAGPAAVVALPALMQAPEQWSGRQITLIAPLAGGPERRVLGPGFSAEGEDAPVAIDDPRRSLWLADPLPPAVTSQLVEGANYLKLRGRLSPPGAYGTGERFLYQFSADAASLLTPERTTLTNLAGNRRALDAALLEVEGTLLATSQGALVTTAISAGGVPAPGTRQVKLGALPDQRILDALEQSGEVRYGPVTIVGWWQGGLLTPFLVRPQTGSRQ